MRSRDGALANWASGAASIAHVFFIERGVQESQTLRVQVLAIQRLQLGPQLPLAADAAIVHQRELHFLPRGGVRVLNVIFSQAL
jgi:hypothetical protein